MCRDLLVARRNQLDAVARLVQRIEHADIAVAANAEHIGNIVFDQIFGDQLGALHPWHRVSVGFGAISEKTVEPRAQSSTFNPCVGAA